VLDDEGRSQRPVGVIRDHDRADGETNGMQLKSCPPMIPRQLIIHEESANDLRPNRDRTFSKTRIEGMTFDRIK
jgi:hypothetical protein